MSDEDSEKLCVGRLLVRSMSEFLLITHLSLSTKTYYYFYSDLKTNFIDKDLSELEISKCFYA
jgi:hypothetical protein